MRPFETMQWPLLSATLWLTLWLAGCGSLPPPPATHAHFDAIQRQEAILESVRNDALEPDRECDARCPSTARGCVAAQRICEIAGTVTDDDADTRCSQAKDRCEVYRASSGSCDCGSGMATSSSPQGSGGGGGISG